MPETELHMCGTHEPSVGTLKSQMVVKLERCAALVTKPRPGYGQGEASCFMDATGVLLRRHATPSDSDTFEVTEPPVMG